MSILHSLMNTMRFTTPLCLLALVLALSSCTNEQRNTQGDRMSGSQVSSTQLADNGGREDLDFGEGSHRARPDARQQTAAATSRGARAQRETPSTRAQSGGQEPDGPVWSVVLNTFSGEGHERLASTYLAELPALSPELAAARVRTTDRGSVVLYGAWAEPDDPKAAAALDYVKSITHQGIPAFPRAFLSRFTSPQSRQAQHPHALLSVRREHPNVDPLYTLIVAAWSDFDTGQLSLQEIERSAEAYAAELRSKGHQAYFHHDPNSRISTVTVGIFDRTAINLHTGEESAELRQLRRNFSAYLVNGEPVQDLKDRRNPARGTRTQEPRLGVVPRK